MSHVVIVGSGIAGLVAALEASRRHDVTLITKAELGESNTRYAQGGIAAAIGADDSTAAHLDDTVRAGAGLVDARVARILCDEGPARLLELVRLGVPFDLSDGELARALEAAHSHPRVVHAGGDSTGFVVEATLSALVASTRVTILEHTFLADLLVDSDGDGDAVVGVTVIDALGRDRNIAADAVILASGGAGQLFAHTTNPLAATGDGVAAALRAGAVVADVEFYQFHPTALAVPGNFLVSEAVRGEGAVLRDATGHRFMVDEHPDAELAPRDLGADFVRERFPAITRACRVHGFDLGAEAVPVTPAAHYWMGGIRTDDRGRTSLPGLYAVGEAANTGAHGANRLASNSLLEALVFGVRCAEGLFGDVSLPALDASRARIVPRAAATETAAAEAALGTAPVDRTALQQLMWDSVGLFRDETGLAEAAATLDSWRAATTPAKAGLITIADRETANLLTIARVVVAAARERRESRGAHFRSDFCETDPARASSTLWRLAGRNLSPDVTPTHAREAQPAC
jgi:L-aspartate oxidase